MLNKFEVGEVVRVVEPCIDDRPERWTSEHERMIGKLDTIREWYRTSDGYSYTLDKALGYYEENWLEKVAQYE